MPNALKKCLFLTSLLCFCCKNVSSEELPNIYQFAQAGMYSPTVKNALPRVYVPNGQSNTVSVIDPLTYKVIQTFNTGRTPQHVVPSYDLQTLWVLNNKSSTVTPIDPSTGQPGKSISVNDPYNLYFTLDGQFAIVVCEDREALEFRDPKTMKLIKTLPVTCRGANHMDFTVDGRFAIVTCEFSGHLIKVDLLNYQVVGDLLLSKELPQPVIKPMKTVFQEIHIGHDGQVSVNEESEKKVSATHTKSMPQDIRSTADGRIFLVADMMRDGVVLIDPIRLTEIGFIPTGIGTHGIYPSRDGKLFYVSNRGCHQTYCAPHQPGSISVVDPLKRKVVATWVIPNGGSPDMGNVTGDGKELWLSGRFDSEVYVFDTTSGHLKYRIPVGKGPHGLTVWPQPGRYSLGHTGNMR